MSAVSPTNATIPMCGLPQGVGEGLISMLNTATSANATFVTAPLDYASWEDIGSFSSFGPTADLRIKPDIVAPGQLLSARSSSGL
jgi:hypothetical protein